MRGIYLMATYTVAYIGPGGVSFTSASAWNFLQRQSETIKRDLPEKHQLLEDAIDFRGDLNDVEDDILDRPWFRRAWVLQEVVVSRRVILQSGDRWVPWDDFCKTVLLSPRVHDRYGLSLGKRELYSYVKNHFLWRRMFLKSIGSDSLLPSWHKAVVSEAEGQQSALDILSYSRRLNVTDQRDKIYALLGVSSNLEYSAFPADYTKSYEDVYLDFARFYLSKIGNYDILSHVDTQAVLPYCSWVPNWMELGSVSRTILSILPKEDDQQVALRKKHVLASQYWEPLASRFSCYGEVIGTIIWKSMSVQLNGAVEDIFEKVRDEYGHDQAEMNARILNKWERLGYGTADLERVQQESLAFLATSSSGHVVRNLPEWATWPHYAKYQRTVKQPVIGDELVHPDITLPPVVQELVDDMVKLSFETPVEGEQPAKDIADRQSSAETSSTKDMSMLSFYAPAEDRSLAKVSVDIEPPAAISENNGPLETDAIDESLRRPFDEQGVLEQQLLRRSHKTVAFSNDEGSKAVSVIIDSSSIIDQRCFAKFTIPDEPNTPIVALVPPATAEGDLIVSIHGARLPFVVRSVIGDTIADDEERERMEAGKEPRRHFMFVGECLFNDFEIYDWVGDEGDAEFVPPYTPNFVFH